MKCQSLFFSGEGRPWWQSDVRSTGDQQVAGSIPAGSNNILS